MVIYDIQCRQMAGEVDDPRAKGKISRWHNGSSWTCPPYRFELHSILPKCQDLKVRCEEVAYKDDAQRKSSNRSETRVEEVEK
jgi:hypothetical protein